MWCILFFIYDKSFSPTFAFQIPNSAILTRFNEYFPY